MSTITQELKSNLSTILYKQGYFIPKNDKYIDAINLARKELMVEPYDYFNIKNKKKPIQFPIYQENENYFIVPKYYGIKKLSLPHSNHQIDGEKIKITFKGNLRDQQKNIIDTIIPYINTNEGGILCLPCGTGKTIIALYLATYFKVKTLIIVHKTFLLHQWKKQIIEFTNANIGIIKQDKIDITNKDIVIGMLQSIAKDKYTSCTFKDFGLVIFDEAHHAPSKYFSNALPIIACKLTIGLSATPKRTDKLEKVLYWYFGDIMYQISTQINNMVVVNIINYDIEHDKFHEFKLKNGDINRPLTISKITTIGRRNKFIVEMIQQCVKEVGRKIIVLSDRIEHLKLLKKRLDNINNQNENESEKIISDFYIGGMKQIDLDKTADQAHIILASYAMAAEGLDIPNLNTLFMVTSRKEVEQAVGRIIRKLDPKLPPIIYDIIDNIPCFVNQGRYRKKLYTKLNFKINTIYVHNNVIIDSKKETTHELLRTKASLLPETVSSLNSYLEKYDFSKQEILDQSDFID